MLPSLRDEIADETDGKLDSYRLDVTLDPATSTIGGSEEVTVVNTFGEPLDRIALRVYPNAVYYNEASTTIEKLRVDDEKADGAFSPDDDTVYWAPLESPLKPGESVTLSFDFATVIPTDSFGTYGIFSHDTIRGTWVLADWYPIVAGYEPGTGWYLDAPTNQGDPTFSNAATYTVTVDAPEDLRLVSTGSVVDESTGKNDVTHYEIVSGPAREFTFVFDDNAAETSAEAGDVQVNIFNNPDTGSDTGADLALQTATSALEDYSERFGQYPYEELDLVEMELAGAYGVSWSGVVFLDSADFLASSVLTQSDPSRLAFTIAHEIGHQWWGAMIGSNSNDHTFIVEGLTNYLAIVYFEDQVGADEAARQLEIQIVQPYRRALTNYGDGIVDLPIEAPRTGASNSSLQYGKAALGFMAIREEIGDDAFFSAIADYAEKYRFGISEPDDLLAAFESASGEDLESLWSFWFEEANTTEADIDALLAASPDS
jgi:hypothetical protein